MTTYHVRYIGDDSGIEGVLFKGVIYVRKPSDLTTYHVRYIGGDSGIEGVLFKGHVVHMYTVLMLCSLSVCYSHVPSPHEQRPTVILIVYRLYKLLTCQVIKCILAIDV